MGSFQSALTPLSPSDNLVIQKIKVKARFENDKLKMTYRSVKMATVDLQWWSKVAAVLKNTLLSIFRRKLPFRQYIRYLTRQIERIIRTKVCLKTP